MTEAELIKAVRTQLGLSQQKFAKEMHVAFSTVNRWENGRTTPTEMARVLMADLMRKNNMNEDWINKIKGDS